MELVIEYHAQIVIPIAINRDIYCNTSILTRYLECHPPQTVSSGLILLRYIFIRKNTLIRIEHTSDIGQQYQIRAMFPNCARK